MAIINSMEREGNLLFKRRSFMPLILFVLAIPVVYFTPVENIHGKTEIYLTILSLCISFSGLVIRAIAIATTPKGTSGRNTKEGQVAESLNTTGIYSIVRHPLYLGNYLMWIGIVIFTFNFYFVIVVSLLYWIYYERIMFAEERFLERKFGDTYLSWADTIPAFIPSFKNYKPNLVPFSFKSILRREYSGVLATIIGFVFIFDLRFYFENENINLSNNWHVALFFAALYALILRSLKHYTRLLNEEGRS